MTNLWKLMLKTFPSRNNGGPAKAGNHEVLGEMPKRVLPESQPAVAKPSALTPNFTNCSNFLNIFY